MIKIYSILIATLLLAGCYGMRPSRGGGQKVEASSARKINPADIALPPGYKIEAVASGLTFPSAVAFDEDGQLYVIETGYSYGEVWGEPRLMRVGEKGATTIIARGTRNGPWNGLTSYRGAFYVAEGGQAEGGRILRITPDGKSDVLVSDLPSIGDHHTNGPVIKDNHIYFGQGTATNSGVVGPDNAEFGWLKRKRDFHDIPCKDITLAGVNYDSENPLTDAAEDKARTGAFVPFGTVTTPGQVIKGKIPCNGSVLRVPLEGGKPELVAWGFRNPFGLAVAPDGRVFVSDNGYDDRGSRPVWGTGDVLWELQNDAWYGWPDYSAGKPLANDKEFRVPGEALVTAVLKTAPGTVPRPSAVLGVHSSSNGMDFSRAASFGHEGELFVAQFGDMSPKVGKVLAPVGYKVVRVDVNTGVIHDFAVNRGKKTGPASWIGTGGIERPVSVKFSPDGKALYIVDFGILTMTKQGPMPQTATGVIWKITKSGS